MDTDNSGTITADELREAMKKQGSPLVQEELQRLLESIDVDATGRCTAAFTILQNKATEMVVPVVAQVLLRAHKTARLGVSGEGLIGEGKWALLARCHWLCLQRLE